MNVQAIHNDFASGRLQIVWDDNVTQEFSSSFLRTECQCAICKANRINDTRPVIAESVRISEIRPVGAYGIQLIFNDGHDRGIYPWIYLRSLDNQTT